MLIIGLTGGIGSGKTAVAGLFAELGVPVIDTDQLAREVVSPGEPLLQQLAEEFGRSILSPGGELNRRHLRDEIFTDPVRRKRLEEYLHPAIKARLLERLQSLEAPYCVVAVPLLIEAGWQDLVDRVAVVDCPQELQRERVVARDGTGLEQVEAIMATQLPRAERLAYADDVIDNSGSPEELRQQVDGLHHQYLALAAA